MHLQKKLSRALPALLFSITLAGCANLSSQTPATPSNTEVATDTTEPQVQYSPLDGQTMYTLLTAEMALDRQEYELGLQIYLQVAEETGDPGAAERAALIAQSLGYMEEAWFASSIWLASEPGNARAHQTAAVAALRLQQLEQAQYHLSKALALNPQTPANAIVGDPEMFDDQQRQALLVIITDLTNQYPRNEQLWLSRARLELTLGATEQALNSIGRSMRLAQSIQTFLTKAEIQLVMGETDDAIKTIDDALKIYPNDRRLVIFVASMHNELRTPEKALPVLRGYHAQNPEDQPLTALYARIAMSAEQIELAKSLYDRLTLSRQFMNESHYYLGTIAEEDQDLDQAMEHYRQVRPSAYFSPAIARLSNLLIELLDIDSAIAQLDQYLTDYPDQVDLYTIQSSLYQQKGQVQDAYDVLSLGLAIFPENTQLLYNRGLISEQLDMLDQLEQDLRKVIELEPDNASALNALGYTFADHNIHLEEARTLITQAYELDPDDPAIIDSLGWLLYREGQLQKASEVLLTAYQQSGFNAEIAAHYGEVLWTLGQKDDARTVWRKGLENEPDNMVLLRTLERLNAKLD